MKVSLTKLNQLILPLVASFTTKETICFFTCHYSLHISLFQPLQEDLPISSSQSKENIFVPIQSALVSISLSSQQYLRLRRTSPLHSGLPYLVPVSLLCFVRASGEVFRLTGYFVKTTTEQRQIILRRIVGHYSLSVVSSVQYVVNKTYCITTG